MIYVAGGIDGVNSSAEDIRLSRVHGSPKKMPSMKESRHAHAVAANEHTVFVLGDRKNVDDCVSHLTLGEYLNCEEA